MYDFNHNLFRSQGEFFSSSQEAEEDELHSKLVFALTHRRNIRIGRKEEQVREDAKKFPF